MKKILHSFSVTTLAAIFLVSCGGKNTSREVANTWLTGFYHMDYEAAKKVSTEDTKALLSQLSVLSGAVSDSVKKEKIKVNIVIKDDKETGDTALVTYCVVDGKDTLNDMPPLKLIRSSTGDQKGKWLVLFTKNEMGGPTPEPANAMPPADSTGAAPASPAEPGDTSHH
jgi:hypothetical protein